MLENKLEIRDVKMRKLEWELDTLLARVKDAEGLEINLNLEKRIDVLTSLLVILPKKLDLNSVPSSPCKMKDYSSRSMLPKGHLSLGGMQLSLNTGVEELFPDPRRLFDLVKSQTTLAICQRKMRRFPLGTCTLKPLILPKAAIIPSITASAPLYTFLESPSDDLSDKSVDLLTAFFLQNGGQYADAPHELSPGQEWQVSRSECGPSQLNAAANSEEPPQTFLCNDCKEFTSRRTFCPWIHLSLAIVLAVGVEIKEGPGVLFTDTGIPAQPNWPNDKNDENNNNNKKASF
ncbi:hypothetical protein MMC31_000212 [Peltigera leucophlebia]|nr:hypothetical protein [Peltigera leucophlebia]